MALAQQIDAAALRGLVAVGSGGSFSAAYFAAESHQTHTRHLSRALTPLQAVAARSALRSTSVLLLSARGKNADIVGAARIIAEAEPRHLLAMTMRDESPLADVLAKYRYTNHVGFTPPHQRDGFLSTNSLLAFLLLIHRAYSQTFNTPTGLPDDYSSFVSDLHIDGSPACVKDRTILTLYGSDTAAGAYDFESKMSEAALGSVLLSDYRNFAHGRHFWLAKRSGSSAVVAFHSSADAELVKTTIALLPSDVPVLRISAGAAGPLANIRAVLGAMRIVGDLAEMSGANISRPGVPDFGRRIFHSAAFKAPRPSRRDAAVERKLAIDTPQAADVGAEVWNQHYDQFVDYLEAAEIQGLVADYDGTLCGTAERFTGVGELATDIERLLTAGITLGIATGRGDSVASDLRRRMPQSVWPRVIVGHYNGGLIRRLDEDVDFGSATAAPELSDVAEQLKKDEVLMRIAALREQPRQLTIRAKRLADIAATWARVSNVALRNASVAIVASSHSLDVIPRTQSKLAVVSAVQDAIGANETAILCIGDKGGWPGNDYELLQLPLSLSVDEVSPAETRCWNVAPAGWRGPQATALILAGMKKRGRSSTFRLRLKHEP